MTNYIEVTQENYESIKSVYNNVLWLSSEEGRLYKCPNCLEFGFGIDVGVFNEITNRIALTSCDLCKSAFPYKAGLTHLPLKDYVSIVFSSFEEIMRNFCKNFKISSCVTK